MICEEKLDALKLPELWPDPAVPWETRRREIAEVLQRELFGYRPPDPEEESFELIPEESEQLYFCAGKAPLLKYRVRTVLQGKPFSFPFTAVIPRGKKDLPFFIHINFRNLVPDQYMPTEELVDNGVAVFSFGYEDVTTDDMDFTTGLAGLLYEGRERSGSDCGKIPMWSWAASRVMDFCRTLDCLDFSRSAVVGHSRLGKTALYTGMMDERFAVAISNESGFAGAALNRSQKRLHGGCSVRFCCENHMQWFAPNYRKYAGREEDMPYDQHFLVAASAPRRVYVASALEDTWSDPETEYLSCCAVDEVYRRLGLPGFLHPDRDPVPGDVFSGGYVAYHLRPGAHFLSREDWDLYCRYLRELS